MSAPRIAAPRHAGRRKASPIPRSTVIATNEVATAPVVPAMPQTRSPDADAEARRRMIAEAAYYAAEKRGFAPGGDVDDWLCAEAEIERRLCV